MALIVLGTAACTTGTGKDSIEEVFGLAPIDRIATPGSAAISALSADGITMKDIVRASFEIATKDLEPCLGPERKQKLESLRPIQISSSKSLHVLSYYNPKNRTITVSELTWRNFAYAAMSSKLVDMDDRFDFEWHTMYRLYLRKKTRFDDVLSPPEMAGLPPGWIGPAQSQELIEYIVKEAHRNATFLLAHEYYHHFEAIEERKGEGRGDPLAEARQHELDADNFAMYMMLCRSAIEGNFEPLMRPQLLFLDWILLAEGEQHSLDAETHPLDHYRAEKAALFVIDKLETLAPTSDKKELIAISRELVAKVRAIDREGAGSYFARIDQEANTVSREALLIPQ